MIGVLELNRNADNYFAEIEQVAMSPSNIIPGIGFSPDKMLQGRIFSYADAHRYRLGTHYEALPVNKPRCPVHHYHKDGAMRFFANDTGNPDAQHVAQGNDRHGHAYGDKVLRKIADVLRECVDSRDMVGRYGGEEFAILFPGLGASAAAARAEQIRRTVQERVGDQSPVTISIGVASTEHAGIDSPNALFRAADEALYRAKDRGRNRVVGYAEALPESLPTG